MVLPKNLEINQSCLIRPGANDIELKIRNSNNNEISTRLTIVEEQLNKMQ